MYMYITHRDIYTWFDHQQRAQDVDLDGRQLETVELVTWFDHLQRAQDVDLDGRQLETVELLAERQHLVDERLGQEVTHPEAAVDDVLALLQHHVRLVVAEELRVLQLKNTSKTASNSAFSS